MTLLRYGMYIGGVALFSAFLNTSLDVISGLPLLSWTNTTSLVIANAVVALVMGVFLALIFKPAKG